MLPPSGRGRRVTWSCAFADDVDAGTRKIREFNEDEVFLGGELLDTGPAFVYPQDMAPHVRRLTSEGATWVRLGQRRPVREIQ